MDKELKDYVDEVWKLYPYMLKKDVYRIMEYGFKQFYLFNLYGCDVSASSSGFSFYSGYLFRDSLLYWEYYRKKLLLKIRILFNRNQDKWDGYYYFALTETMYKDYLKQKKTRGRPKKWFLFEKVLLFKNKDECSLKMFKMPYIFKCKLPFYYTNNRYYKTDTKLENVELIEVRDSLKFEDILVTNNKYNNL